LIKAIPVFWHIRQAALREPGALRDWTEEFGSPDKTLATFPDQGDNEVANRLIELARSLGVDLTRTKPQQPRLVEPAGERALNQAVSDYYRSELVKTGGEVGPPDETLRAALEGCRPEIGAIINLLSDSTPAAWETRILAAFDAPIPNLSGQIHLLKVLAAEALNRARLGQTSEAERAVDASWALNSSLRDRPDLASQLIAVSIARIQVGLVRRIPVDPVSWSVRFSEHDYRASLLKAIEVESISALHVFAQGSSWSDCASRADFLDLRRALLVRLRDSPVSDGPASDLPTERRSPGGIIESIMAPNLVSAMRRVDRLIVDQELTERLLAVRLLKARLGHWPDDVSNLKSSRLKRAHWNYAVSPDGRMAISLSREAHWEDLPGAALPLRYESD
jgi:hypothetical protein